MNYFTNLIRCLNCGKKYNFKNDHGIPVYICSGTKNYGNKFCPRRIIREEYLLHLVEQHCKINNTKFILSKLFIRELIHEIIIDINGEIKILYNDGKISKWDSSKIIY